MICAFIVYDRKRKAWARRRRQSGTKPSLKTVPKEDDSDDACKKCFSFEFWPQFVAAVKLTPSSSFFSG